MIVTMGGRCTKVCSRKSRRRSASLVIMTLLLSFMTPVWTLTPPASAVSVVEPTTGCSVILIGCVHGSKSSSDDVEAMLEDGDVVALELCYSRFADLRRERAPEPWLVGYSKMVKETVSRRGLPSGLAAAVLGGVSGLQMSLLGLDPGLEFRTAHRIAQEKELDIVLADQTVDDTLEKLGSLPQVSADLLNQFVNHGWADSYGREAGALRVALWDRLTLPSYMMRSRSAVRDLVRMTIPPVLLIQAVGRGLHTALEAAGMEGIDSFPTDTSTDLGLLALNAGILVLGYLFVVLPAVKVVLRERDEYLVRGIRSACERATDGSRVVAVLGLLHVNGVAKKLADE